MKLEICESFSWNETGAAVNLWMRCPASKHCARRCPRLDGTLLGDVQIVLSLFSCFCMDFTAFLEFKNCTIQGGHLLLIALLDEPASTHARNCRWVWHSSYKPDIAETDANCWEMDQGATGSRTCETSNYKMRTRLVNVNPIQVPTDDNAEASPTHPTGTTFRSGSCAGREYAVRRQMPVFLVLQI